MGLFEDNNIEEVIQGVDICEISDIKGRFLDITTGKSNEATTSGSALYENLLSTQIDLS